MSESLLSFSEVLLFGRVLHDIEIREPLKVHAATKVSGNSVPAITGGKIDGTKVEEDNLVAVQTGSAGASGIYTVLKAGTKLSLGNRATVDRGAFVFVRKGDKFGKHYWRQTEKAVGKQAFDDRGRRQRGKGNNNFLGDQFGDDARLARIYGFSYEGTYYELPEPCVFLVHGRGDSATDNDSPAGQGARAPLDPSVSGVASADYQMANDIRVWDYDKADYSIRMDVLTGQFEQILLDLYFGFDSPAISGAKVSGAKVSGAKVSGAKVSGAKVSGAKVSGAKARGSGD